MPVLVAFCGLSLTLLLVAGCAQTEVTQFQAAAGQQTMIRDGVRVIYSPQQQSLVLMRPAKRQFQSGKRPAYVVAIYNSSRGPLQFLASNVHVEQVDQSGQRGANQGLYL